MKNNLKSLNIYSIKCVTMYRMVLDIIEYMKLILSTQEVQEIIDNLEPQYITYSQEKQHYIIRSTLTHQNLVKVVNEFVKIMEYTLDLIERKIKYGNK